jgi:cell division septal protein FtsQ
MSDRRVAIGGYRGARGRSLARPRRAPRSRLAIARAALLVAVGLGAVAGGSWWLLNAPTFAVARAESGPYRFSDRAQVDATLQQALGRNIWRMDGDALADAFTALPWVRAAHVTRRVPDAVAVELEEWRPLASVAVARAQERDEHLVLVGDGRVLPVPQHLDPPALPLLVGAGLQTEADGTRRLEGTVDRAVRELLEALAVTGFEATCPVDFLRVTPQGLAIELARRGGSVQLGREDFQARLDRFLLARDRIPAGAAVDLRFADRITFEPPTPGSG